MKRIFLVTIGFLAVTVALTWLWVHGGQAWYGKLFARIAPAFYDLLGIEGVRIGSYRLRYINWIPFVGLLLVTPGLTWKRRSIGLVAGLALMPLCHLLLNMTEDRGVPGHMPLVPSLVSDALPFFLWVILAWPVLGPWFEQRMMPPRDSIEKSKPPS